jgi:hypothetical protein
VKTILASLVIAVCAVAFMSSEASAWVCYASSPSANGWGSHNYSLGYAKRRALAECSVRTPRYQTCYITGCR